MEIVRSDGSPATVPSRDATGNRVLRHNFCCFSCVRARYYVGGHEWWFGRNRRRAARAIQKKEEVVDAFRRRVARGIGFYATAGRSSTHARGGISAESSRRPERKTVEPESTTRRRVPIEDDG